MNTFWSSVASVGSTQLEMLFKCETHEMCQSGVIEQQFASKFLLFKSQIQEICKRTVEIYHWLLDFVSNEDMNQTMCRKKLFQRSPYTLKFVYDQYKTKEMRERALDHSQKLLRFFLNCFVTPNILDNFDNDNPVAWYISRQKKELLSIT